MNIICILWLGDFRGRDFKMEDVERLYQSVNKHIDRPFTFYCLNNLQEGYEWPEYIHPIPLKHNWPGWWTKMELHRPDLPAGRTLYLDLDSHVIRNLQPILDFQGDLVMFETRQPHRKKMSFPVQLNSESSNHKIKINEDARLRDGWVYRYQAATMLFDSGTPKMVQAYNLFKARAPHWMIKYRSDQDVMGDWLPDQPMFPSTWMMKLVSAPAMSEPPKDCIIVTGQDKSGLFRKTETIPWFESMAR